MVTFLKRAKFAKTACLIITVVLIALPAFAWETTVDRIHDGDTIKVSRKDREVDVRFYGIDCPEKDQPYGMQAKRFVQKMCRGRTVEIIPSGQDRYGRVIGLVKVNGKILNEALIMNGLAWVYDRYRHRHPSDPGIELPPIDLEEIPRMAANRHFDDTLGGSGAGHHTDGILPQFSLFQE